MGDHVVGLIGGGGRLPVLVAEGMKAAGVQVCGVGLRDHYDEQLPGHCDFFDVAGPLRLGRWIRILKGHAVTEAILVGTVSKRRMHDPLRIFRQFPDWRAAQVWYRKLRDDRRSHKLLLAVAEVLQEGGVTLIDSTRYITAHLADEGLMTATPLTAEIGTDIQRGWHVLRRTVELDIGQSLAVSHGRVIAVESLEGTDAMINRAGRVNGHGAWTLLKTHRDDHDMRFDVPTVGLTTIRRLSEAGACCLAMRAGGVIMIDKPRVVAAADDAGIAMLGINAMKRYETL